jgi:tetratricopeptide (TPR) repeat protein
MGQRLLESYFASGARDKGTALLSDLAARYPKDAVELYFIAGRAFQSRDQFDDAIGFFKKAAELAPPAAGKDRVGAKLLDCYLSKNDADAAQKLLDQLSRDHPNRAAYLHRVIGERYQTQRKLPEAVAAFKKSLELTIGSHSPAHYRVAKRDNEQLVTYYQSMGSFGEMEKQIQSMIATYPDASGGWKSNLGRFYVDSGAYEKAIPVLTEVIGNYPNCASGALVLLVEASSRLGKGEEALAQLKDYYKDKPELKAEFLQTYGRSLLMGTRDYSKSADVLKQFISEYPDSPQLPSARKLLASALEMAGRTDEAVEALKSSLPGNATPKQKAENWRRLATIYYKAKRWREALKAYKEVRTLKDAPDEMKAEATYRSGLCYREIDYDNSARRCMQEVARRYGETRWASRAEERLQMWSYVEQHY